MNAILKIAFALLVLAGVGTASAMTEQQMSRMETIAAGTTGEGHLIIQNTGAGAPSGTDTGFVAAWNEPNGNGIVTHIWTRRNIVASYDPTVTPVVVDTNAVMIHVVGQPSATRYTYTTGARSLRNGFNNNNILQVTVQWTASNKITAPTVNVWTTGVKSITRLSKGIYSNEQMMPNQIAWSTPLWSYRFGVILAAGVVNPECPQSPPVVGLERSLFVTNDGSSTVSEFGLEPNSPLVIIVRGDITEYWASPNGDLVCNFGDRTLHQDGFETPW